MQHCQFCDKELFKVVEVMDYITCGFTACKRKAIKSSKAISQAQDTPVKKVEGIAPVLIIVFSTKTPLVENSWLPVAPCDHPEELRDPDVLAKMLDEGVQVQVTGQPDTWYQVERTEDVREKLEKSRPH